MKLSQRLLRLATPVGNPYSSQRRLSVVQYLMENDLQPGDMGPQAQRGLWEQLAEGVLLEAHVHPEEADQTWEGILNDNIYGEYICSVLALDPKKLATAFRLLTEFGRAVQNPTYCLVGATRTSFKQSVERAEDRRGQSDIRGPLPQAQEDLIALGYLPMRIEDELSLVFPQRSDW